MAGSESNAFWEFSLAAWRREGVEHACLALQERHGLDVNLLLLCGFAGRRGQTLDIADLHRLIEGVRPWREDVVLPLRRLRRWLKEQGLAPSETAERLRTGIKESELQAEAIEQQLLLDTVSVPDGAGSPTLTVANSMTYFEALGVTPDATDIAQLATVLRACHPELPPLDAVWLLSV